MNRSTPGLPGGTLVKNLPANAGDTGSISGSERSPGGGNGNPFQYCLENPMDRAAWQATYSLWCRKESTEPEMVFGPLRPAVPQFATRWQDDTLLTTAPPKPGKSKPAQTAQQSRPNKPAAGGSLPPPAARKGPFFFPHRRQGTHLQWDKQNLEAGLRINLPPVDPPRSAPTQETTTTLPPPPLPSRSTAAVRGQCQPGGLPL